VTILWRSNVPLEVASLKEAVLRWRGGVRYGGATVTLVGDPEPVAPGGASRADEAAALVRVPETGQRFRLQVRKNGPDLRLPRAGERVRVTGRVIKNGEKNEEIWLEVEHAETAAER
jgi:hypothetical protein